MGLWSLSWTVWLRYMRPRWAQHGPEHWKVVREQRDLGEESRMVSTLCNTPKWAEVVTVPMRRSWTGKWNWYSKREPWCQNMSPRYTSLACQLCCLALGNGSALEARKALWRCLCWNIALMASERNEASVTSRRACMRVARGITWWPRNAGKSSVLKERERQLEGLKCLQKLLTFWALGSHSRWQNH